MKKRIKAIIFDLDGTLINTIDSYRNIFLRLCEISGSDAREDDFRRLIGMPNAKAVRLLLKEKKLNLKAIFYLLFNKKKLKADIYAHTSLYPHVYETLDILAPYYKLAITTSSKRKVFNHFNNKFCFDKYIDTVITQDDVKRKKPLPDPYLETARRLGLAPEDCLVIEDAPSGSISSNRAGMKTLVVLHTVSRDIFDEESKPLLFIDNLSQLSPELVRKLA